MKDTQITINSFKDGSPMNIAKNAKLTEDELMNLKHAAFKNADLSKLSEKQKKQLIAYAISEAEKYSSTHSMRFTIMQDVCKAIHNIK